MNIIKGSYYYSSDIPNMYNDALYEDFKKILNSWIITGLNKLKLFCNSLF